MIDPMEFDIDQPEQIVYVVGLGPGDPYYMTQEAQNTLESVDAICGYRVYIDLIKDEFPCEEYYATGMTQEIDRCRWALEKASTGKRVRWCAAATRACTAWQARFWNWQRITRTWKWRSCPA